MLEFRDFLLLYWLPCQSKRPQSTQLFTHSWRNNSWMHIFPKVITLSKMPTASSRLSTWVTMSISCNGNHYVIGTSLKKFTAIQSGQNSSLLEMNIGAEKFSAKTRIEWLFLCFFSKSFSFWLSWELFNTSHMFTTVVLM